MRRMLGRVWLPWTAIAGCVILQSCVLFNYPTGTIEQKYFAKGPWSVTVAIAAACCDSFGNKFDLYYPTNLEQFDRHRRADSACDTPAEGAAGADAQPRPQSLAFAPGIGWHQIVEVAPWLAPADDLQHRTARNAPISVPET